MSRQKPGNEEGTMMRQSASMTSEYLTGDYTFKPIQVRNAVAVFYFLFDLKKSRRCLWKCCKTQKWRVENDNKVTKFGCIE